MQELNKDVIALFHPNSNIYILASDAWACGTLTTFKRIHGQRAAALESSSSFGSISFVFDDTT
jgi:hypothetical protein